MEKYKHTVMHARNISEQNLAKLLANIAGFPCRTEFITVEPGEHGKKRSTAVFCRHIVDEWPEFLCKPADFYVTELSRGLYLIKYRDSSRNMVRMNQYLIAGVEKNLSKLI